MSAPLREQLKNVPVTTLDGAIMLSDTSITVTDGSVFPATGNFHLRIEDEIMVCTARASNVLTVVRGQEGTLADGYGGDTEIMQRMSTETLNNWGEDNVVLWGGGPVMNRIVADDGVTPLVVSDFTWVNQGGATASDQSDTILMRHPTTGNSPEVRMLCRTAPSAPYSYIMALKPVMPNGTSGACWCAVGFRRSSTGKFTGITLTTTTASDHVLAVANYDDPNTVAVAGVVFGEYLMWAHTPALWLKIEDDNTNLKFYIGDGLAWIQIHSMGRTSFLGAAPDQVWWGGSNSGNGTNESLVRLVHWSRNS